MKNIIHTNSINQAYEFFTGVKKADIEMAADISRKTQTFIDKLSNSSTEIIKTFLDKNAREIPTRNNKSKLYHYDNLLLTITDGQQAYNLEQNLKIIQNKGIAPKYVQYFEIGKDEFLTVLEGDKESLIPYNESIGLLSGKEKHQFKSDLKDIVLNTGFVNKEIFANKEPLFVGKESKSIIYGDWEQLSPSESGTKQQYLNQIEKISV